VEAHYFSNQSIYPLQFATRLLTGKSSF